MTSCIINDDALYARIRTAIASGRPVTGPKAAEVWQGVVGVSGKRRPTLDEVAATIAHASSTPATPRPAPAVPAAAAPFVAPFAAAQTPVPKAAPATPQADPDDASEIVDLCTRMGLRGFARQAHPDDAAAQSTVEDRELAELDTAAKRAGLRGIR